MESKISKKIMQPWPLEKSWNKLIFGNLFFGIGFLMLILSAVFGHQAFNGTGQMIGNLVISLLVMLGSWVFVLFYGLKFYRFSTFPNQYEWFQAAFWTSILIPFIGSLVTFIFKLKEQKIIYAKAKSKNPNFKKPKQFIPNSFTIIFFIIVAVIFIIWIVYFITGGIKTESGIYPVPGLLDAISAPILGFVKASELVIFLLVMGAFLSVVNTTQALEAGVGSLVKKMKGKEIFLIPILMLFFSIGGTTFGMCEETIPFYFIVIPVLLAGGFDLFSAFMVVCLGAGLGVAGSIINPFVVNTAVTAANSISGIDVSVSDGIVWRVVSYFLIVALAITLVTWYAYRVKRNPTKSIVYDSAKRYQKEFNLVQATIPVLTLKRKIVLVIFALIFVIMILTIINWQDLTGFDGFVWLNDNIEKYFPFLSSNGPIGTWYLVQMAFLFLLGAIVIGLFNWQGEDHFFQTLFNGCKDFISVGLIISLATGLGIILGNSGLNSMIADGLTTALQSTGWIASVIILFFVFIVLSLLIPSTSGFASTIFPIISSALSKVGTVSGGILTFSFASGLVNILSPTSGPFVGALSVAKLSIIDYYKGVWKVLLPIILLMFILLIAGAALPIGKIF